MITIITITTITIIITIIKPETVLCGPSHGLLVEQQDVCCGFPSIFIIMIMKIIKIMRIMIIMIINTKIAIIHGRITLMSLAGQLGSEKDGDMQ